MKIITGCIIGADSAALSIALCSEYRYSGCTLAANRMADYPLPIVADEKTRNINNINEANIIIAIIAGTASDSETKKCAMYVCEGKYDERNFDSLGLFGKPTVYNRSDKKLIIIQIIDKDLESYATNTAAKIIIAKTLRTVGVDQASLLVIGPQESQLRGVAAATGRLLLAAVNRSS